MCVRSPTYTFSFVNGKVAHGTIVDQSIHALIVFGADSLDNVGSEQGGNVSEGVGILPTVKDVCDIVSVQRATLLEGSEDGPTRLDLPSTTKHGIPALTGAEPLGSVLGSLRVGDLRHLSAVIALVIDLGKHPKVAVMLGLGGKNHIMFLLVEATAVVGTVSTRRGIVLHEIVLTCLPVTAFTHGHGSGLGDDLLVVKSHPSPKV